MRVGGLRDPFRALAAWRVVGINNTGFTPTNEPVTGDLCSGVVDLGGDDQLFDGALCAAALGPHRGPGRHYKHQECCQCNRQTAAASGQIGKVHLGYLPSHMEQIDYFPPTAHFATERRAIF